MTKSAYKEFAGGLQHNVQVKNGTQVVIYREDDDQDNGQGEYNSQHPFPDKNHRQWMNLKSTVIILLVALPLLLVAITLGWIIIPCFIQQQISNKVVISPEANPELYSAWVHPPVPVYLKIYLFNVTNPEGVRRGALPNLEELGPYVFQENRTKVDISHDDASDTITYMEHISYHFREELSGNSRMDDVVTIVNVPFAAAAIKIAHDLPWPLDDLAKTIVVGYKETLFVQKTVEEALFKGFKVPFLEKIEKDIGINLIPNNTFGFFIGQNDTAQGPYTVSRGTYDKSSFGIILKFKNESHLNFWGDSTSHCNQLQGTDGTIFPPFVTKSTTLRLFNAELCRSLSLTYNASAEYEGIKGYRFTAPQTVLEDPRKGGENRCYCTTLEDNPEACLKQGALDLGPCREGAPVAMSTPHFLDANPEYIEASGLVPDRTKHETFMDIEPMTGLILQASKKIQINLIMKKVKGLASLSRVPEMLFPLVWADECAALDPENTAKFKFTLFQLWIVDFISKWGVLTIALILSLCLIVRKINQDGRKMKYEHGSSGNSRASTQACIDSYGSTKRCSDYEDTTEEENVSTQMNLTENGAAWSSQKVPLAIPEEPEQETQ